MDTVTHVIDRQAADLRVGDRMILPTRAPAEVVFHHRFRYPDSPIEWVLVVGLEAGGVATADFFLADAAIGVDGATDGLFDGRTTACAQAKPDTLGLSVGGFSRRCRHGFFTVPAHTGDGRIHAGTRGVCLPAPEDQP